ncbi:DUF927 domain-containing protein [Actinospica durhamensis]|uniref:DUF927 domain-containing protein n=1 Tax=Actinospica durhamensis TaxID=1508375 RepID=A0A941ELD8_9ACTN|nr:DUF927 domain-containing protein [Actinospica durhamensis]MBR7832488.1 DUF927 domain-containing protein [Actinospica durhamensis]
MADAEKIVRDMRIGVDDSPEKCAEWIADAEQFVRTQCPPEMRVPADHEARRWALETVEKVEQAGPVLRPAVLKAVKVALGAAREAYDVPLVKRIEAWRTQFNKCLRPPAFGKPMPERWLSLAVMVSEARGAWFPTEILDSGQQQALDYLFGVAEARRSAFEKATQDALANAITAEKERRSADGAWDAELQRRMDARFGLAGDVAEDEQKSPMYKVENGCLYWNKETPAGVETVMLGTFHAEILEEVTLDDGAERSLMWKLSVTGRDGRHGEVQIQPDQLGRPQQWATKAIGVSALVMPGQALSDHLRAAVQTRSRSAVRRTVYGHTGWRRFDSGWGFLSGSGALGADGLDVSISVDLGPALSRISLPGVPELPILREQVRASVELMQLTNDAVMAPLQASVYRAPLPLPPDSGVWLYGRTGTFKTAVTAVMQQHFGADMDAHGLPGNWESTANALEMQAYVCANVLFTIDDRAPDHSKADEQRRAATIDRVFRGSANGAGRGRLRPDGTMRPEKPPRAQLLTSAEDVPPSNPSLRARMLVDEINPGMIDRFALTQVQQKAVAGTYAAAMSGYVQWLARQMDAGDLAEQLAVRQAELRDHAWAEDQHARFALNIASLALGWEKFLQFALEVGAITETERDEYWNRAWKALTDVGAEQARFQRDSDPVRIYLGTLNALLAARKVYVADRMTGRTPTNPEHWGWAVNPSNNEFQTANGAQLIGWVDPAEGGDVYLLPAVAYAVVRQFAENSGAPFSKTKTALHKEIDLRKLLAAKDQENRYTHKIAVCGKSENALHLTYKAFKEGGEQ